MWKRCNGEGLLLGSYALYYYKDKNQAAVRCRDAIWLLSCVA